MHKTNPRPCVNRLICYAVPLEYRRLLAAAIDVFRDPLPHNHFPVRSEVVAATVIAVKKVCDAVLADTERWMPRRAEPSTWECVAWKQRDYAERVLALISADPIDRNALHIALSQWIDDR